MNDQTGHPDRHDLDEDRLRDALVMIGDEAAKNHPRDEHLDAAPPPGNPPPSRWRGWKTITVVSAAAAAIVGLVVLEVATDTDAGPSNTASTASQDLSGPQEIACAKSIVEGTVIAVRPGTRPIDVRMTVKVTDWIKPARSDKKALTFPTPTAAERQEPPFKTGERVLVIVPPRKISSAVVYRASARYKSEAADYVRKQIERDLPEAAHTKCPPWGRRHNSN